MVYVCDICDYKTNRKFDFDKHNNTLKHRRKVDEVDTNKISHKKAPKKLLILF